MDGIPSTAKITFGPVTPGTKEQYGDRTKALRIYTTANNQLAVFLNVESFRDMSLTVKEERVNKKLKSDATVGPNGKLDESQYEETRTWEEVSV